MRLASSDLALLIDSRTLRTRSGGANSYAVAIYLAISDDTCDKSHMAALAQRPASSSSSSDAPRADAGSAGGQLRKALRAACRAFLLAGIVNAP